MKQSEAKDFLPLIQAWAEGKTVQIKRRPTDGWLDMDPENTRSFTFPAECYRIKPEPRTFYAVQWDEAEHCLGRAYNSKEQAEQALRHYSGARIVTLVEQVDD